MHPYVTIMFLMLGGSVRALADDVPELGGLMDALESVDTAPLASFGLRDDGGRSMDCLEVFASEDTIYGVYHTQRDGRFSVHLARTENLLEWTHLATLDDRASQATVAPTPGGGFLMAYEKDAPNSCWMRLRLYESPLSLAQGAFAREFDVTRTLAPTAEGTPSVERIVWDASGDFPVRVDLRFHYFREVHVDRAAYGSLKDWSDWRAQPLTSVNAAFEDRGIRGNLGDRSRFDWKDGQYILQEAQRVRGDWSSWRVYLCDALGVPITPLDFQTPRGSLAFANPSASWIRDTEGRCRLVVTLFLPGEGAGPGEAGSALYVIEPQETSNPVAE